MRAETAYGEKNALNPTTCKSRVFPVQVHPGFGIRNFHGFTGVKRSGNGWFPLACLRLALNGNALVYPPCLTCRTKGWLCPALPALPAELNEM